MKTVVQLRYLQDSDLTLSTIIVYSFAQKVYDCCMIELPWMDNKKNISCIPAGSYKLEKVVYGKYKSSFKYDHFHVVNVPSRSGIKWHVANLVSELRGCGAPGLRIGDINNDGIIDVLSSRAALQNLLYYLDDENTLEIIEL